MRCISIAGVAAAFLVLFTGCHGVGPDGGGPGQNAWDGTVPKLADRVTVAETVPTADATNAALPTAPVQGDQSFIDRMLGWEDNYEDTAQWIIDELAWWVPRVNATPNDAAGQIGMSIVLVYAAFFNANESIGLDPEDLPDLPDGFNLPAAESLGLEAVTAQDGAFAGLLRTAMGGTASPAQGDEDDEMWENLVGAQTTIRDMIMPVLQNVMYRLDPLSRVTKDFALIPPTDKDGELFSAYAADAQAMCITVDMMMMVLDLYMSFDIDLRDADGSLNPWDLYQSDANHDGIVEAGEYMPAGPALTMKDRASWEHGVDVARDMFSRASKALRNLPAEPSSIINQLLADEEVDPNVAVLWTDHILRMLTGPVNMTVVHTWTPWTGTTQIYTEPDRIIPINLSAFLDNMPDDIRTIMPDLPYYLVFGDYDVQINGVAAGNDSIGVYEVAGGGGWELQVGGDPMVPFDFATRRADLGGGNFIQLAADWQSFTGTNANGDSFEGTMSDSGTSMMTYEFDLNTWPDRTVGGLLPNPGAVMELYDAYHDADWQSFDHTWTFQSGPINFTDDLILGILYPVG